MPELIVEGGGVVEDEGRAVDGLERFADVNARVGELPPLLVEALDGAAEGDDHRVVDGREVEVEIGATPGVPVGTVQAKVPEGVGVAAERVVEVEEEVPDEEELREDDVLRDEGVEVRVRGVGRVLPERVP